VFCYALSQSDGSEWRQRISAEAEHFVDVSTMTSDAIAHLMSDDRIQILVNLNGYTKVTCSSLFLCCLILCNWTPFQEFLINCFFSFSWALLMGSWISVSHCDLVWHWTLCNPFHLVHIQGARNEIFAMQPAPIQVSYMGFPGTTGAEYIDYLVTDEVYPWNAWLLITIVSSTGSFVWLYLFHKG
jgi:hypothetical protein